MKNKEKFKDKKIQILKVIVSSIIVMILIIINQGKQKVNYLNSLKLDIEGLQENLEEKEEEIDQVKTEKQAALDGIQKLETDYTALKQQTDEMSKQLDNKQSQIARLTEEIIGTRVNTVVESILSEDFKKLSKIVHPEKNIILSPSIDITNIKNRVLSEDDILKILKDKNKYEWGLIDAQGNQILLTTEEYFRQYIKDEDCLLQGKIQYATESISKTRNATVSKSEDLYNNGIYVDYLYEGTKVNNYTDWKSIRFIFEEYQSSWYLTAIITNKN